MTPQNSAEDLKRKKEEAIKQEKKAIQDQINHREIELKTQENALKNLESQQRQELEHLKGEIKDKEREIATLKSKLSTIR